MESIRQTQKKYCSRAITFVIFTGFLFILAGQKPVGKGMILGTIFSVINFVLIAEMLPLRIGKSKGRSFFLSLGSIFFRYALMAIPVFLAIKFEQFSLFAVIFGIFMVQLVILADHIFSHLSLTRKKLF